MQTLLIQDHHSIRSIILNRPEQLNAFNVMLATELGQALEEAAKNAQVRCVILRGAGRAFCAGGDLKMFHEGLAQADQAFEEITGLLNAAIHTIRTMPKPVLAGVSGPAFAAGFGLSLSCDVVLASSSATFSASFTNIGLTPNASTTLYLPRMIGWRRATECVLTGRVLTAEEALDWGLINRVVLDENFEEALQSFARLLANRPTSSLARIKHLMNESLGFPFGNQLEIEKRNIVWSATTENFAEGVRSFVQKRKPEFKG